MCPVCPVYNEEIGGVFCGGRLSFYAYPIFSNLSTCNILWYTSFEILLVQSCSFKERFFRRYTISKLSCRFSFRWVKFRRNLQKHLLCDVSGNSYSKKQFQSRTQTTRMPLKLGFFLGGTHHFAMFRPSGTIFNPLRYSKLVFSYFDHGSNQNVLRPHQQVVPTSRPNKCSETKRPWMGIVYLQICFVAKGTPASCITYTCWILKKLSHNMADIRM